MKPIDPDKLYSPLCLKFHFKHVLSFLTISIILLIIAIFLDYPVWQYAINNNEALQKWTESDSYRMLRVMGYLPVWIAITIALILHDTRYLRKFNLSVCCGRGLLLILTTATAGVFAEVIKMLVRRERPPRTAEELNHAATNSLQMYNFRTWFDSSVPDQLADSTRAWHDTGGLGFPSSHAIVAFAAAFILSKLYPRATAVWLILATGCAATRVLRFGHYVSDVTASAIFAFAIAGFWWNLHLYNQRTLIRDLHGKLPIE